MNCADYQRRFSDYLDALLSSEQKAQLEEHLRGCVSCHSQLRSLQQMLHALHMMERPKSPDLLPGIHERLLKRSWWEVVAERFQEPWPQSLPVHGLALATASVLLVLAIGIPSIVKRGVQRDVSIRYANTKLSLSNGKARVSEERQNEQREGALSLHAAKQKQGSSLDTRVVDSIERSEEEKKPDAVADAPDSSSQVLAEKEAILEDRLSSVRKDAQGQEVETGLAQGRLEARDDFDISHGSGVGGVGSESKVEEVFKTDSRSEKDENGPLGLKRGMVFEETTPKLLGSVSGGLIDDKNQKEQNQGEQKPIQRAAESPALPKKEGASSDADNVSMDNREYSRELDQSLHVQWQVEDIEKAIAQVSDWVVAKKGLVKVTDERHLEIQLSSAEISTFLQQFSSHSEEASRDAKRLLGKTLLDLQNSQAPMAPISSLPSESVPAVGPASERFPSVTIFLELLSFSKSNDRVP